ncbi:collagen alpha-1(I) chain-like [Manis pentadactyla]|uniref:collagen alpha-1(I) chain-like n=1 Tax=Manis pentadactyla TaxID=143292 RepID=UPI00255C85CD|nr:collagen alpha-1(I) chain-like [Manis pentadactyla]
MPLFRNFELFRFRTCKKKQLRPTAGFRSGRLGTVRAGVAGEGPDLCGPLEAALGRAWPGTGGLAARKEPGLRLRPAARAERAMPAAPLTRERSERPVGLEEAVFARAGAAQGLASRPRARGGRAGGSPGGPHPRLILVPAPTSPVEPGFPGARAPPLLGEGAERPRGSRGGGSRCNCREKSAATIDFGRVGGREGAGPGRRIAPALGRPGPGDLAARPGFALGPALASLGGTGGELKTKAGPKAVAAPGPAFRRRKGAPGALPVSARFPARTRRLQAQPGEAHGLVRPSGSPPNAAVRRATGPRGHRPLALVALLVGRVSHVWSFMFSHRRLCEKRDAMLKRHVPSSIGISAPMLQSHCCGTEQHLREWSPAKMFSAVAREHTYIPESQGERRI